MSKIVYFDICAVPIFISIISTIMHKKMTKGRSNRIFLLLLLLASIANMSELVEKLAYISGFPMTEGERMVGEISEYVYFICRNGTNYLYVFYIYSVTRTWYRIDEWWKKLILSLPYIAILIMLATNEFTHGVFYVTAEAGYQRGHLIMVVYALAFIYMIYGVTYMILNKYTIDLGAWLTLLSMYVFNLAAVVVQFVRSEYLVECFATAITLLFIVLFLQRPEKQVDINTELPAYRAFCEETKKIMATKHNVKIVFVSIKNAGEMVEYLGEEIFYSYIHTIDDCIQEFAKKEKVFCEDYYELPGNIYVLFEDDKYNPVQAIPGIRDMVRKNSKYVLSTGAVPDVRIAMVTFPEEIDSVEELLRFGHNFVRFADVDKIYVRGSDITKQRRYQIETHLKKILDRAISEDKLKLKISRVRSLKDDTCPAAVVLSEIEDEEFGIIDEETLKDAAKERGLLITIGNMVLDKAFAYAAGDEMEREGYSFIIIRISATTCMQMDFTDKVWEYREKYGVHPEKICFAIREISYNSVSDALYENLNKLKIQGYNLALDRFGEGYMDLQKLFTMHASYIMLYDEIIGMLDKNESKAIVSGTINTVSQMKLKVIACGEFDDVVAEKLRELGCDMIQG